jgi:hypothetical protein
MEIKMKKLPIAAAALLFGTSAYAMVSTEPTGVWVDKDPYAVTNMTALGASASDSMLVQPAAADWWDTTDKADAEFKAVADASLVKADLAASDDFAAADAEWEAAAAAKAAAEGEPALESAIVEPEPAAVETTALDEEPVPVEDGVGGPYEAVADATPRPAAQNYPACRPGPGDDRCIQLYEPGVRAELASWNQPTGGFAGSGEIQVADSTSETERLNQLALADSASALQATRMAAAEAVAADTVAVGGPYEPVEEAALMNGDGTVDNAMGEVEADEEVEV